MKIKPVLIKRVYELTKTEPRYLAEVFRTLKEELSPPPSLRETSQALYYLYIARDLCCESFYPITITKTLSPKERYIAKDTVRITSNPEPMKLYFHEDAREKLPDKKAIILKVLNAGNHSWLTAEKCLFNAVKKLYETLPPPSPPLLSPPSPLLPPPPPTLPPPPPPTLPPLEPEIVASDPYSPNGDIVSHRNRTIYEISIREACPITTAYIKKKQHWRDTHFTDYHLRITALSYKPLIPYVEPAKNTSLRLLRIHFPLFPQYHDTAESFEKLKLKSTKTTEKEFTDLVYHTITR